MINNFIREHEDFFETFVGLIAPVVVVLIMCVVVFTSLPTIIDLVLVATQLLILTGQIWAGIVLYRN